MYSHIPQAQANRPIGELRKEEEMKQMDPETAAVYEWAHGKERNLRALLCSLHSVIWDGSRWAKCGMHQVKNKSRCFSSDPGWTSLLQSSPASANPNCRRWGCY